MFRSPRARVLAIIAAVVLLAGIAVGAYLALRDDAPEEASIDDAGETLDEEGFEAASIDDVAGTWRVTAGPGDADDTTTFVGYRVDEELGGGIGAQTAAGRTGDVTGTVTIVDGQVTEAGFEVDMTTLRSNEARRDNQLRGRGLETDAFPTAGFELTEPVPLPDDAVTGERLSFTATGDLTLHGVTKQVTIELEADLREGLIAIVGAAPIVLADYEIEPPEGGFIVSVADEGTLEFQLFLEPA
ncbi:MAG TPA: YceI family protein [Acidimicrobiales bacterium]